MLLAAVAIVAVLCAVAALALWLLARGQLDSRLRELRAAQEGQTRADADVARLGGLLAQAQTQASSAGAQQAQLATSLQERESRLAELRSELAAREAKAAHDLETLRAEVTSRAQALAAAQAELAVLSARAQSESAQASERLAFVENAEARLRESFQSLSGAALERSSEQLLKLAEARFNQLQEGSRGDLAQRQQAIDALVAPVRTQLEEVGKRLQEMEVARGGAYEGLSQQVRSLAETQGALRSETQRLVSALRAPQTRGRWAEIHLRRVVELAGMQEHCDFIEQASVTNEEGTLRPDMVVTLPGGSHVVIDAKAPLAAWLDAHEAGGPTQLDEAQRKELYRAHARQVRTHVEQLARKSYWAQFEKTPDFVVLFLPTEAVLGAALEADPELHEQAMADRVVLATPMTLIALLRTVAYGWRQDALAQNARKISEEAQELYGRLATLADHFGAVGKQLKGAVEAYNKTVGSLELRVLPAARKFQEYRAVAEDAQLPALAEIESSPREIQAPELLAKELPETAN
jgi:DNA recombination protein RmuC